MIVDYITQIPGGFETPSNDYKGKRYRTVLFLDDFKIAQFYEVNNVLIRNWKKHELFTSEYGEEYASMNLSLDTRKFCVAYHDNRKISMLDIINKLQENIGDIQ